MLQADHIDDENIGKLTNQLNAWLGNIVSANVLPDVEIVHFTNPITELGEAETLNEDVPQSPYVFGETFTMYYLDVATIQSSDLWDRDFSKLAIPARRRYHQLRFEGRPIAYAHSIAENDEVCQLMISNLALDVQKAMKWLDEFDKNNPRYMEAETQVRMLAVPAYNVTAFWIFDESNSQSDILVISAPESMAGLRKQELLDTSTFLQAFAEESPITGLE